ncbi:MAG: DNA mismatch repair protein MutS [Rhodobiaceae bacterium]|nr:DNA mismatch repair protein MutS [Rhodobiaceae bacterium]RPF97804.1 MAG: DNA mismatch repair protein MutS [Rhizobiales bacterium TMED227]
MALNKEKKSGENSTLTPMMAQYSNIKSVYPDHLLLYQMGDFYEMFFEDAIDAAPILGITLTKRGYQNGEEIPMCGIPISAVNQYIPKLINNGQKVAICEQSKQNITQNSKKIVERKITRIITSGTLTDDSLLNSKNNNFLLSIYDHKRNIGLSWCDISTGEIFFSTTVRDKLDNDIFIINPKEILIQKDNSKLIDKSRDYKITEIDSRSFQINICERLIREQYQLSQLDGFGINSPEQISAIGSLLGYIELTQIDKRPLLQRPKDRTDIDYMLIDEATQNSLEILSNTKGGKKGSLLSSLDKTITSAGGRKLYQRVIRPSTSVNEINLRLADIEFSIQNKTYSEKIRNLLKEFPDITRPLLRLSLGRSSPRDMGSIRLGLGIVKLFNDLNDGDMEQKIPLRIKNQLKIIQSESDKDLFTILNSALNDNLPNSITDGNIFRDGFSEELDQLRLLKNNTTRYIIELQEKYINETNIKALKIKYNNFLGYFIECPSSNSPLIEKLVRDNSFIHRQTLKNQIRFTTAELNELQTKIIESSQKIYELEENYFNDLSHVIIKNSESINLISDAIAEIDITISLAKLATEHGYCKPLVNDSKKFIVEKGRHIIVEESLLHEKNQKFIANDCTIDDNQNVQLITGPNMAGKSTYLRQNALIAIIAQIGSYVPAKYAEIGIIDKIFSRVGASDDLAAGRSTFMVEMVETSIILNQATSKSFVIIDEIGRGTATFDGLAIAWATLEFLAKENNCRTIFATHFHELTNLSLELKNIQNMAMQISEQEGEIIFLHEIKKGIVDKSYGIQVSKLAGLPTSVTQKAEIILKELESKNLFSRKEQLSLFTEKKYRETPRRDQLKDEILKINIDEITPIQALNIILKLQDIANDKK